MCGILVDQGGIYTWACATTDEAPNRRRPIRTSCRLLSGCQRLVVSVCAVAITRECLRTISFSKFEAGEHMIDVGSTHAYDNMRGLTWAFLRLSRPTLPSTALLHSIV